jgi:hypothetical protein
VVGAGGAAAARARRRALACPRLAPTARTPQQLSTNQVFLRGWSPRGDASFHGATEHLAAVDDGQRMGAPRAVTVGRLRSGWRWSP